MIKRILLTSAISFGALLAAASAPASADTYNWTLSDNMGLTGTGTLALGISDHGGFDVTSFTGTINGEMVTGLVGGNPGYSTGNGALPTHLSPSGAFNFDNILYTSSDSDVGSLLDNSGLLLSLTNHDEANIFGNNATDYAYYNWNSGKYDAEIVSGVTFTVDPVPEPASMALLGAGLFGLGAVRHRRQRA